MNSFLIITGWRWPFEPPKSYGWYHLTWILIMILMSILFAIIGKRQNEKENNNKVILGFAIFLLIIETYKQIFYAIAYNGYQWYSFPFQFCSLPLYISLVTPFIKNKKIHNMFISFLAFYGTTAGLSVMFYPGSCLTTPYITILLHTMAWHTSMVVLGIYLLVSNEFGKTIKEIIPGFIVFFFFMLLAIILNFIVYNVTGEVWCNFMYLSKYDTSPFPILCDIKEKSYILYLILYFIAFSVGNVLIFYTLKLINKIKNKKQFK